jgi:hypothetical protein
VGDMADDELPSLLAALEAGTMTSAARSSGRRMDLRAP